MGKYNGAVITAAGQNLIAQAIAESKTVTFTTAQASSHVYPSSTDFEALTALTDVEKTVDINYAGVYSDTVVQVSARFDNDGVETAYLINTLGFFAQLGTDTPILFAVSTAVTPDQMPVFDADNPSAFIYNMQITVQNADSVTVTVNPAGTVTVGQLDIITNDIYGKIGDLTDLATDNKTSLVNAINEVNTNANAKAPKNHASTATTYGAGNATKYGHVKLSDSYSTVSTSQKAANSIGASAWALQTVNSFIGKLSDLTTTIKNNLVAAVNEVDAHADAAQESADIVQAQVSNSGDAYNPTRPYVKNELCIHNDILYRCTTPCSAGSWEVNQSCFTPDTLTRVVSALGGRYNFKYFDVTMPANSSSYNYLSSRPSDFDTIINAISIGGTGTIIRQCTNEVVYFNSTSPENTVIRIFYQSY